MPRFNECCCLVGVGFSSSPGIFARSQQQQHSHSDACIFYIQHQIQSVVAAVVVVVNGNPVQLQSQRCYKFIPCDPGNDVNCVYKP